MSDRQELMRNAVAFLSDPKTQTSPLAQRIQFLEAKGLTSTEIEEVMRQASFNGSTGPPPAYSYSQPSPYASQGYAPGQVPWDWRDYFITAVVSGVVVSGLAALTRKYLLPHLQPPTTTAYESDRDALTAQFDAAEALLKEIKEETTAVKDAVAAQQEQVEKATSDVQNAVKEMRDNEASTRDALRDIRAEVDSVREMLPKMIEKTKDSEKQSLAELQQELKSLKALLLSRSSSLPSAPASPAPVLPFGIGRPGIPAWQLATPTPSSDPVTSGGSPPPVTTSVDKGKAPERMTEIPP